MKKFLLCIVVLVTICLTFALSACNNATPQGQLGNYFNDYEKFIYDVVEKTDSGDVTGEYVIEIEKMTGGNINVGEITLSNQSSGHLISSKLTIGTTVITSYCYFINASGNNFYVPKASYKLVEKNGVTVYKTKTTYQSEKASYRLEENGKDVKSGTLELKSPYYDNLEFYSMLRGASTMGTSFTMSYNVALVSPNEIDIASLNVSCGETEKLTNTFYTDNYNQKVDCYKAILSRSTKVSGLNYTIYYGKNTVEKIRGNKIRGVVRPIVKIVEDTVTYTLKNMSVIKGEI